MNPPGAMIPLFLHLIPMTRMPLVPMSITIITLGPIMIRAILNRITTAEVLIHLQEETFQVIGDHIHQTQQQVEGLTDHQQQMKGLTYHHQQQMKGLTDHQQLLQTDKFRQDQIILMLAEKDLRCFRHDRYYIHHVQRYQFLLVVP